MKRFLAALLLQFTSLSSAYGGAGLEQNSPIDLLKKYYENSRVLVLAANGHTDSRVYEHLKQLLQSIGQDPRLKLIALERPHDGANFYEALSTHSLSEALALAPFKSEKVLRNSLCQSAEWAYTATEFMPIIQNINMRRGRLPPVIVLPMDSAGTQAPLAHPKDLGKPMRKVDCNLNDGLTLFAASRNREQGTANIFLEKVVSKLAPGEKAIVMYHYAHVTKGFTSCMPSVDKNGRWKSELTKLNWLSWAENKSPESAKDIGIILFDGTHEGNPFEGTLNLSARLALERPGQDWGVDLARASGVEVSERGLDAFLKGSFLARYHEGQHFGTLTVKEMYQGIIWTDLPRQRFPIRRAADYLPSLCHDPFF